MEDDENYNSLSIDDRLSHKLWKARQSAYDELTKLFQQATSGKDAIFRDRFDDMRKAPMENNAAALDSALNAMQVFVRTSDSAIKNFGANTAGTKSIVKLIPAIFQHSDKNVRAEGTLLVVELARWIGPAINSFLEGLKPVQVKELQDQISKVPMGTARPLRWRRSEQPAETGSVESSDFQAATVGGAMDESSGSMSAIIDAYSLSEPVNVLDKIPASFYEGLESTKWKDRKDALDSLLTILKVPKIADGHFGTLVSVLVKKVADVNVMVATADALCIAALAEGLRKGFSPHRNELIPAILERCKEKNKSVLEALRAALDSMIHTISCASELAETCAAFFKHKNPQVKAETLSWISRAIPRVFRQQQAKKEIKTITDAVVPCMDDGVAEVREAATAVLVALVKFAGEKQVAPFLDKLDKIKLAKVLDSSKDSLPSNLSISIPSASSTLPNPRTDIPLVAAPIPTPTPVVSTVKSVAQKAAPAKTLSTLSFGHSNDESVEIIKALVGEDLIAGLADTNWKNRLTAIESLSSKFEFVFPVEIDSESLVRFFSIHPGWKETNFQVFGRMLSLLTLYAEKQHFTPEAASLVIPNVIDKFADSKLGTGVGLILSAMAERTGLAFISQCLEGPIATQKSPKVLTETFNWLASSIMDFGVSGLDIQFVVSSTKVGIANSNVAVRSAAFSVAVALRRYLGGDIKSMYSTLLPAQLATLEGEFAKVAAEPAPIPIKKTKGGQVSSQVNNPSTGIEIDSFAPQEELIPRNDLTAALAVIVSELSDSNWKIRKEAMDKALDIINKSGNHLKLSNKLKGRYSDSNKNLIAQALDLTSAIAIGMGMAFEKSGGMRIVLGPAAATLADNKPQVRAAALKFLSAALSVGSLGGMANPLSVLLAGESPNLRRELLTWLGENSASIAKSSEEDRNALLGAAIACLQDRTQEVRKASNNFLDLSIDYVTSDTILRLCQATKPALLPQVKQIIDAHQPKIIIPVTAATIVANQYPRTPQKPIAASTIPGASGRTPKKGESISEPIGKIFISEDVQLKAARIEAESRGGLKWAFDTPRADFCDLLKGQMQGCVSTSVIKLLFSEDFKDAISGMSAIDACIVAGSEKEGLLANADFILKYLTIRLFDTNTSVLIKTFDLIEHVLGTIDESNLRLSEVEASSFLPQFVQRAGELKEPIKGRLRGIYRQLCRVYPASKIFVFLLEGLKSKSSRARVECLNEMEVLISRNGLMVVQPSKHIPTIASVISDRDSHVRNAALNVLVQLHELLGESLYKHMSFISQKDLDMFQERLRRFKDKTLPPETISESEEEAGKTESFEEAVEKMQVTDTVPQVFALDPSQYGSPARRMVIPSLYGTPNFGNVAPTPALPITSAGFYQSTSLEDPLERVIQQIGSSTDLECITALQRLDEFMTTPATLLPKIDPLVNVLVVRLHECTHTMMDMDANLKSRLCRYVTNALVLIVAEPTCISHIDVSTLTLLIRETLLSLVNGQIILLEDRDQLGRALNVLLVKCLENSDHNKNYRALLSLLEQAFRVPPTNDDKYSEYVMKCLWKLTKQLPAYIQNGKLDVTELLGNIHNFFCSLPPMEWKTRAAQNLPMGDLPLRTVKTILHELATTLGDRVIPCLRQIDNVEQSFVTSYIRAMLAANNVDVSGLDFTRYPPSSAPIPPVAQLSAEHLEELLKDICSKICSKPNTRAGLLELYDLQRHHPYAADFIDSYLEKLGNFFCKYIKRNLAHIETEVSRTPLESDASGVPFESYKAKLAQIQMSMFGQGGLVGGEPSNKVIEDQPMMSPVRNRLNSPAAKSSPRTGVRGLSVDGTPSKDSTIVSLKERLAKLRQGGEP